MYESLALLATDGGGETGRLTTEVTLEPDSGLFHTITSAFFDIVLRFGKPEKGLFGKCTAYYGTITEAQARGTPHCHMLIWLEGHPGPQKMRSMAQASEDYRAHLFACLESIIKSKLLGATEMVGDLCPRDMHSHHHNHHPVCSHVWPL
ncbi:hypothetical protein GY45DRAFT_701581 [Cubamyces sp. BRFM 1775]|nr:hypothetical protein GY45DRAFT_701581 [Cubamyces sp. BRFM 1775]